MYWEYINDEWTGAKTIATAAEKSVSRVCPSDAIYIGGWSTRSIPAWRPSACGGSQQLTTFLSPVSLFLEHIVQSSANVFTQPDQRCRHLPPFPHDLFCPVCFHSMQITSGPS